MFKGKAVQYTLDYLEDVLGGQYEFVARKNKVHFPDGYTTKGWVIYVRNVDNDYMKVFSNSSEIAHWVHTVLCSCENPTPDIMDTTI